MTDLVSLPAENAELKKKVNELRYENNELKEQLKNMPKEEAQLLYKIQKCKIELKKCDLKKSGKTKKYDYFELSDFIPQLEQILYDNKLGSYFNFEDNMAYLIVFDSETGICHKWSTKCILIKSVEENKYDVGMHMKNEQAIQTYARRTLYLQAFDILEPNAIESEDKTIKTKQKTRKPHQNSWKHTLKPQKEPVEEITAERVQEIISIADKQWQQKQLQKLEKDRQPFTWNNAKDFIKKLCDNEEEYKACSQSLVFQKADTIKEE